ncbi:hypothetical+protein [Methylocapsa aurea]|uniref:hypothetical protein n=1 Tax=Methylocapsa aurea TaxID=663610 RepID=UPI003D18BEFC
MQLAQHSRTVIDEYFASIVDLYHKNQNEPTLSYVAIKKCGEFYIVKCALTLNVSAFKIQLSHFKSDNIRAGAYNMSDLNINMCNLIEALLSGQLQTPHGVLRFVPNDAGNFAATREPFHSEGIKNQARFDVLTIFGGSTEPFLMDRRALDWELRASPTPYDSLDELASEYGVAGFSGTIMLEVLALHLAAFDFGSSISGNKAKLAILVARGLPRDDISLGYRIFDQGRVVKRSIINGLEMKWTEDGGHQRGEIELDVPSAAVIQCFANYRGITQHFGWAADDLSAQNPRRMVYSVFDQQLAILDEFISKSGGKGRDARDLEVGFSWLLWMLGFSVAHLGATPRTQEAVDLIATTPAGHFAVVECTTGLLKADQKLSLLISRAEQVRQGIVASNNKHLRVLPVIVSSRPRTELLADMGEAEKHGVLVLAREDIQAAIARTLVLPNPDKIYEEAVQKVEADKARHLPQPSYA